MENVFMDQFSIRDLESFTGIKAHTIRIWEQRYNLLEPQRTDTNIRVYGDNDLKKLLNVSVLNDLGFKISKIVDMSDVQMNKLLNEYTAKEGGQYHLLNILKIAMLNFDEELYTNAVNGYLKDHQVTELFSEIFLPMLWQLGLLWQTNTICPAHEHFISNLIRQKISAELEKLSTVSPTRNTTFTLFLPMGEIHELSLMMVHYHLRFLGFKVVYLGQSVPVDDLTQVASRIPGVQFVSYLTTGYSTKGLEKFFTKVNGVLQGHPSKIHLTGACIENFGEESKRSLELYSSTEEMIKTLAQSD